MQTVSQPFEFHGKAGEFFKIWIVNVMLSIVTLGIYSAWAKVRTKRYFYNNTLLLDTPFDYLADPIKILKGRLLAVGLILIYSAIGMLSPIVETILVLLFVLAMPWIIIKSLKFNLYNSAYRNIRFHFDAKYSRAFEVFVAFPFLIPLTLGLAYPAFVRARKKFIIDHSALGTSSFRMSSTHGQFYVIYLKAIGAMLAGFFVSGLVAGFSAGFTSGLLNTPQKNIDAIAFPIWFSVIVIPLLIATSAYLYTSITNLVINHTQLQQHRFESRLKATEIVWLYLVNTLAIIFSLGLMIPWAKIRTTRYRLSCLSLICDGDLDAFVAGTTEQAEALGEELDEILDLDIGM